MAKKRLIIEFREYFAKLLNNLSQESEGKCVIVKVHAGELLTKDPERDKVQESVRDSIG